MKAPSYTSEVVESVSGAAGGAQHLPVMMGTETTTSGIGEVPAYVDLLPPCNMTCPAGENIQEWMRLVQLERYEEAWRALVRNNPFPAIHGRVCYHPCENGCNRKRLEQPVSIHGVERFLGDLAIEEGWWVPAGAPTGKRVLVIGSGPCGLSAAYHLALAGHAVTVYESAAKLGGMMRYAIPAYRLPRAVLDAEIARLGKMGVVFETNKKVENLDMCTREGKFDAVLVSVGAQVSKRMEIAAADAGRVLDALKFLAAADEGGTVCAGRRVAVYGGGNTAMDAARTAKRLGAAEVKIIYRRDQARMPAHQQELADALAEGVAVHWLRTIQFMDGAGIEVEVMELDSKGQARGTGRSERIEADLLILALGQETDAGLLKDVAGVKVRTSGEVEVDGHMMTGCKGVFAGGDMVPSQKTVTTAVGHGKKAAKNIDAYLKGRVFTAAAKHAPAKWDRLHVNHYRRSGQAEMREAEVGQRVTSFEEVVRGFDETTAKDEAGRCLSCGNCFECDTCYSSCPCRAIEKLGEGKGYEIKLDDCVSCGLCVNECPCGAMSMVEQKEEAGCGVHAGGMQTIKGLAMAGSELPAGTKVARGESVKLPAVVIRFAGDSGDGMQLAGMQFTDASAMVGNDVRTLPDYPSEIRAPAGTLAGVSGYQIQFASHDIFTPGDEVDTLVAMNPAAVRANLRAVRSGGMIVVNQDAFTASELKKAGYESNPLTDGSLAKYRVIQVPIDTANAAAVAGTGLTPKQADLCKNFFALGLVYWLYDRPLDTTLGYIEKKFGKKNAVVASANAQTLRAGYNFGETSELFGQQYQVDKAKLAPGTYRKVVGNEALALGLVTAAELAGKQLVYPSYPITPASEILHELAGLKHFGVVTFQAEDEICAMGAAIGAAFGGAIAVTGTSGPGLALKTEAMGLAVMTELPVVIVDVQRGGPSTGLPTKMEQSDLLQNMFGRNGDCPMPVIAAVSPADCFNAAVEAVSIAVRYMTPVVLLSDGYIANGSEPWRIPEVDKLPKIKAVHPTEKNHASGFMPYLRNSDGARPWAVPGTPGLEHRIGGLEKQDVSGAVCHEPMNHEKMTQLRAAKVANIQPAGAPYLWTGRKSGDVVLVGWGGTYGAIRAAAQELAGQGYHVSACQLRYLNPLPADLGDVLRRFKYVVCPELNMGQLKMLLRAQFLMDVRGLSKVQGQPFTTTEIMREALRLLGEAPRKSTGSGGSVPVVQVKSWVAEVDLTAGGHFARSDE